MYAHFLHIFTLDLFSLVETRTNYSPQAAYDKLFNPIRWPRLNYAD